MSTNVVSQSPARPNVPGRPSSKIWAGAAYALFWGWNLFFLALVLLGFLPLQLPELIRNVREGITPISFVVQSAVIIFIPVLATVIALVFLRRAPARLFALGYVVEWPLMLVLLVRFFLLRQGNPAVTVLLVWLAVAELTFLWYLIDRRSPEGPLRTKFLRLAGLTLLFAGTLYAAAWLLFYVPPLAVEFWNLLSSMGDNFRYIIENTARSRWYEIPLAILAQFLFFFSILLLLIMPVAGPILAGQAWWRSLRSYLDSALHGARRLPAALAVMVLPLALVLAALVLAMRQPQQTAFALLKDPPATPQASAALMAREDELRAGLLNAYLASYRYLGSAGEVNHINDLYHYTLGTPRDAAYRIERAYETFLLPFLYRPVHITEPGMRLTNAQAFPREQQEAARLYERYFDQTIIEGERQTIVDAVRSTPDGSTAEAAWQAVDDREVRLNRQEVTLSEHGDWAEVTLHEVYENRTSQRQEVVYYFSLPESAVITGLWLGDSDNRAQAFAFQVAPRGAAQEIYRSEVRYMRDPALVEQIGPRQYRLRAFPVEPRTWNYAERAFKPGPEMHLWLAYRTLSVGDAWPLPRLAERRNVYWNQNTQRTVNGHSFPGTETAWLPDSIPASQAVTPAAHRVDFSGALEGTSVVALPAAKQSAIELPDDLRAAVVLDRSFSMRDRAGEVSQAFAVLEVALSPSSQPDVYLTASEFRGEQPVRMQMSSFDPSQVLYMGGQNAAQLLVQYQQLNAGEDYDLVLVLTDGSGYELGDGGVKIDVPSAPLWVVHLGGGFPLGYDDATQQAIQASGGGVAASVEQALARFAAARGQPARMDQVDGYTWQTLSTAEAEALAPKPLPADDGFAALAARRVLLAEMAQHKSSLAELPILDDLHALAVQQGIVTPYSSMIVLVNEQQRQQLEALSQEADRYSREVERIGLTEEAGPLAVTGVPEPEEWLLIALAAALLLYANRGKMRFRKLEY